MAGLKQENRGEFQLFNLLNISSGDEMGGRWNGFDVINHLAKHGFRAKIGCFWNHTSNSPNSFNLFPGDYTRLRAEIARGLEIITGRQATFQSWSRNLLTHPEFQKADVVHLQVVNDHFLTVETIRQVLESKPTVWTWHDLWPITGHCIFPGDCSRFTRGCGDCPALKEPLEIVIDRTRAERQRKDSNFRDVQLNIHVTTDWMEKQIKSSISGWHAKIFKFPFGIDTDLYKPRQRIELREKLGLKSSDFVIFARSTSDERKNFQVLVDALDSASLDFENLILITVQEQGLIARSTQNLRSIEFPWTNEQSNLIDLLNISDLFAMPSKSETFGMMALEAMACGLPVLCVTGTATAEVAAMPQLEVSSTNTADEIISRVSWAIGNRSELAALGEASRNRAEQVFSIEIYLENLTKMYREVMANYDK